MKSLPALWVALLCACSSPPETAPTVDAGPTVVVPDPPEGPHLAVTAVRSGADVDVQVRAHGLGSVFGVSYHLVFDPAVLQTQDGAGAQDLGLGDAQDVHAVLVERGGEVVAGGVRKRTRQGDAAIPDGHLLLQTRLRAVAAAVTTLRVERVVVKRANGTPVAAVGTAFPVAVAP